LTDRGPLSPAGAKTLLALSRLVVSQIRGVQGVEATETLVQAEL
jgi:hypothetical protein